MNQESLYSKITELARLRPGKTAIKSENRTVSYLELENESNQVANFMHGRIAGIPHVIIILERSPWLIASIIGLLKCGMVFVPLNPLYPPNRVKKMIEETRAQWVITDVKNFEKFKNILANHGNGTDTMNRIHLKTLLIDGQGSVSDTPGNIFYLDRNTESSRLTFEQERQPNKNCCIYFTSGSTGEPKAVLGRERSLVHFMQWEINEFAVDEGFNVSQLTPPSFDPYLRDIFVPLMAGGTTCIPSKNTLMNMRQLTRWIDENQVTLMHTVPSLFKQLVTEIQDANCFHHLKYILLAGELLRAGDIYKFIEIFKERIQLVNVYGPTETTLAKLFYRIQPQDLNRTIIPVGKPIDGAQVLILDSLKQKCRPGKKGEIYIRTPFISSGYYNDPRLTREVFIKNPYGRHPNDIIYKTGDLGRLLPDGNIELSGRIDFQVKIRGIRIEIGEIENRLLAHQDIQETVVIAKDDENGDKYLCAYVIPAPGKKPRPSDLRKYLSDELPGYMIPSYFVFLDKMPLTLNGKLAREMLPAPKEAGINLETEYKEPRGEIEQKIAQTWTEFFGVERIGIDDNFFELGGDSLKAMVIISRIQKKLGVEPALDEFLKNPTIRNLAISAAGKIQVKQFLDHMLGGIDKLQEKRGEPGTDTAEIERDLLQYVEQDVILFNPQTDRLNRRKLFCFPPGTAYGMAYKTLSLYIPAYSFYAFNFIEEENRISKYVEIITNRQPADRYILLAYSAGARVTFEVANALENSGFEVSDIILVDSFWPRTPTGPEAEEYVVKNIEKYLEELGVEFLKEKIIGKVIKYRGYFTAPYRPGVVNANVHLILSEENIDAPLARCWEQFTTKKSIIYRGIGEHHDMMTPAAAAKNAGIIQEIVEKGDSRD
jgi:amino acid adenylation domain-containing protein